MRAAVSFENGADRAELNFDLTQPVAATSFVLAAPDRIVIDLPDVDFHIDPQVGEGKSVHDRPGKGPSSGLIASFRFGLFAPGKSRIVIDLAAPARVLRAIAEPAGGGTNRDSSSNLPETDAAAFQAAARNAFSPPRTWPRDAGSPAKGATDRNAGLPVIVIDPGHGGVDSGAIVNGLVEKNIVFAFAKALDDKLAASGHYKVVMTRDSDVFLALGRSGADRARFGGVAFCVDPCRYGL